MPGFTDNPYAWMRAAQALAAALQRTLATPPHIEAVNLAAFEQRPIVARYLALAATSQSAA
ncbi:hypothetical protein [Paludibacterium purpuratum]|uniref:Uncharacterized protein n=1 Tax=Paludibacterium purpuratum TaxID=1144873 RepID=A0A4R7B232_9NEIS|nr:hypothetical protein [Paludibacterium purpuratum]TDR77782.1 hypothetical protein DFP86_10922 [Paludibacterium purpuratum]